MIKVFDRLNLTFTKPKLIVKSFVDINCNKVLGGEHSMSFTLPITAFTSSMQTDDFVEYDNVKYMIKRFTKERAENGLFVRVECVGIYEMLIDYVIEGEDTWLPGATLSQVITRALRGTPFKLMRCESAGLWDIELEEMNVLEAINKALGEWPKRLELYFIGFDLYIVEMQGTQTGTHLSYHKNLGTIVKTEDSTNVVTRLKGRGNGGLTIEGMTITGIPSDDLRGFTVKNGMIAYDYIQTSTYNEYAYPKTAIKKWDELDEQKDLFYKLIEYSKEIFLPKVTYEVSYVELQKQGVNFNDINLGDFITVTDVDLNIGEVLRVVELNEHPLKHSSSSATLATKAANMVDFMSELKDTKSLIDKVDATINSKYNELELAIQEATKILNMGDSTVIISENDGIFVIKKDTLGPNGEITNTTQYIKMANGAIGCTTDGGNSYRTAMTPYGINADTITSGIVRAQYLAIGSLTDFAPGYDPLVNHNKQQELLNRAKAEIETDIANNVKNLQNNDNLLNKSISETMTAQDMLKKELQGKIDILNKDISGLNGSTNNLANLLAGVQKELTGNSFFTITSAGIRATDTSNTNYQMWLNAKGFALSTNGGRTWNNAITASGIMASQVNIGTFSEGPFKGLVLHNKVGQETFAVDTNGNVSLMGNINMQGGSIAWANVTKMPYDALDTNFKKKFTYIDSNGVYTKLIEANQINAKGLTIKDSTGKTTFAVSTTGAVTVDGNIKMGAGSVIDWAGVTAPTASQVGARPSAWVPTKSDLGGWTTKIDANGIYTGTLKANQIVVGGSNGTLDYNALTNKPTIPNSTDITTITGNYIRTANVYAQNLEVQSANIRGTIKASNIVVGGSNGTIDYATGISNKPTIPTNADITTITNSFISTTSIYARYLQVSTINLQGTIKASQIEVSGIDYNNLANKPTIPTNANITTIAGNYIQTANLYAQNLQVKSANIVGTLTANQIRVGGSSGTFDYRDLSYKPSIPTNSDITTITSNYISTASIYARYLQVNSANIQGSITATDLNTSNNITVGNYIYLNERSFGGGIKWSGVAEIFIDPAAKSLNMLGSDSTTIGNRYGTTYIRGDVVFDSTIDVGNGYVHTGSNQEIYLQVYGGRLEWKQGRYGSYKALQNY